MPSLKEVRIRIASVKSTQQITSAMKMVAASKLRRAQSAILKMRPYSAKLLDILQNISASLGQDEQNIYAREGQPGRVLMVIFTSNRGLCGAFNANVVKMATQRLKDAYSAQITAHHVDFITIGRKGTEFFTKRGFNVISSHDYLFDKLTYENASVIAQNIMQAFVDKKYDRVELVYNQFKNAAVQRVTIEQFLPIQASSQQVEEKSNTDFIYLPSKQEIVTELIPKSLRIQFYKAALDSFASEHGARMTAMHQATDNAQELIKQLNLTYNKARQAAITKEILEIVGGAEALKNQ